MNDTQLSHLPYARGDELDLHSRLEQLEAHLAQVRERNHRVELSKAWETSRTRLVSVVVLTYGMMVLMFSVLKSERAFLDALVPTLGFFLSTLSLPLVRRVWEWWLGEVISAK